jgi:hypothetical protein
MIARNRVADAADLRVGRDEWALIHEQRRATLDAATAKASNGQGIPVAWRHGWKCQTTFLGRDVDGSLKVRFRAWGPFCTKSYVRNVRLCKKHTLNL